MKEALFISTPRTQCGGAARIVCERVYYWMSSLGIRPSTEGGKSGTKTENLSRERVMKRILLNPINPANPVFTKQDRIFRILSIKQDFPHPHGGHLVKPSGELGCDMALPGRSLLFAEFQTPPQTYRKPSPVSLAQIPTHLDSLPASWGRAPLAFSAAAKHPSQSAKTSSRSPRTISSRHPIYSPCAKTFSWRHIISTSCAKTLGSHPKHLAHVPKHYPVTP